MLCMLGWVALCAVSLIWTLDFTSGLDYVLSAGNMAVFALVVANISWKEQDFDRLLNGYSVAAVLFAFCLLVGRHTYLFSNRYTVSLLGVDYDPNVVAGYLAPAIMIVLIQMIHKKINLWLALGASIVMGYASFLTGSRGGVLALGGGVCYLIGSALLKGPLSLKQKKYYFITLIIIFGVLWVVSSHIDTHLLDRVFHIDMREGSSQDRLFLIRSLLPLIPQHPVFGLGCAGAQSFLRAGTHNMFLLVLADTGGVGFILFMSMLGGMFFKLRKSPLFEFAAVLVSTAIVIFFLDSYHAKYMWNILIFIWIYLTHYPAWQERPASLTSADGKSVSKGYSK